MSRRISSLLAGVGLAALLTASLAACASDAEGAGSDSVRTDAEVDAAWLDDGRMLGVVTWGSSTCVPMTDTAMVDADGTLAVTLVDPEEGTSCTRDMAPRVSLVSVPDGVDPSKDLTITVSGEGYTGETELDGADRLTGGGTTDFAPSAGWIDEQSFIILTWGSSSCVPIIDATDITGPSEVTVTFAEPAADKACTMDMAPRATIAAIDLEEPDEATLVLTGDGFDGVSVPILG